MAGYLKGWEEKKQRNFYSYPTPRSDPSWSERVKLGKGYIPCQWGTGKWNITGSSAFRITGITSLHGKPSSALRTLSTTTQKLLMVSAVSLQHLVLPSALTTTQWQIQFLLWWCGIKISTGETFTGWRWLKMPKAPWQQWMTLVSAMAWEKALLPTSP